MCWISASFGDLENQIADAVFSSRQIDGPTQPSPPLTKNDYESTIKQFFFFFFWQFKMMIPQSQLVWTNALGLNPPKSIRQRLY